jgi:hypothetical protein
MTSLKYNTFNDSDLPLIIEQSNNVETPCLICLQGFNNSNDEIKSINDMHFLKKSCNCKCYSHHKCIELWIETNSVCPICKTPLLFPQNKVKKNKPLIQIERQSTYICTGPISAYICITGIVIVCFVILLGKIIN